MTEGRTIKSIKNLFYSYLGQFVNIILKFLVRSLFVRALTTEYLGLNGLFGNILTFLSFAELGIGGAITYNLYIEIAKNNSIKIKQLMRLYKNAYLFVGIFVLIVGTSLTPFIKYFISSDVLIPNIHIIYLLFVLNSGTSYFFSYKASFITANQNNYIVSNFNLITNLIIAVFQILILLIFRNYIAYLSIQIIVTLFSNMIMALYANKKYPILKEKVEGKLDVESKKIIIQNVSASIFHKMGAIIVFSTDNILMAKLCGLIQVGLYSNYTLITKTLQGIISQFFVSITASVGNLCVEEKTEKKLDVFYITEYINFIFYSFSSVCVFALLEEFIALWIGSDFFMNKSILCLLVTNFYIEGMRSAVQTFNGAMGLARFYKFMPVPECIVNLTVSILLGVLLGPTGILIGTLISTLATAFWIEPRILFKYGINANVKKYYLVYIKFLFITVLILLLVFFINKLIIIENVYICFIVHGIVCLFLYIFVIFLFSRKTKEFAYLLKLLNQFRSKKNGD